MIMFSPRGQLAGGSGGNWQEAQGGDWQEAQAQEQSQASEAKLNAIKYLMLNLTQAELEIKTVKFSVSVIPKLKF